MRTLYKSTDIAQLLRLPELARSFWEGKFTGVGGSVRRLIFHVHGTIVFCGTVIDGDGRGVDFPSQPECSRRFILEGSHCAADVNFHLWFEADFLCRTPLVALGSIAANNAEMSGSWSLGCFTGCGCGGGYGNFVLYRIDT
jgi:hypothetical protein